MKTLNLNCATNNTKQYILYSIFIYNLPTYIIIPLVCFQFIKPFHSHLKIRNDWAT